LDTFFFVTLETEDATGNSLVRIDTQKKTVESPVSVDDSMLIIMWDYTTSIMYMWCATETYAGVLGILDISTGKTTNVISKFTNYSGNGGATVLDVSSKIVYGSLLDLTGGKFFPSLGCREHFFRKF